MPYPLPLTRTEAYLAYKAGVIQQSDLKPSLAIPRNGIDAWLAYWTGLAEDYPKREDGTPHILQEEEAYIAYLCGVINEYPEKCLRRVGAYLRYLISARWGRPDHPLNREELYLSLIKTQFIPSGDPSSDIVIDGTAKAAFVDVKMYGDTEQQSYTGKNILNLPATFADSGANMTTTTSNGLTTISSSGTTRAYPHWCERAANYPAGTYTFSISKALEYDMFIRLYQDSSTYPETFTIRAGETKSTKTIAYDVVKIMGLIAIPLGSAYSKTFNAQVESGSAATSFEPYVGGQPSPSPDYPQLIQTVTGEQTVSIIGKNLFDKDTPLSNKYIDASGNWITGQTIYIVQEYKAIPSSTYTFSFSSKTGSAYIRFAEYDSDGNFTKRTLVDTTNTTLTLRSDTHKIAWSIDARMDAGAYSTYFTDLQIEAGTTATTYEPYNPRDYKINLGKNLFDGVIYSANSTVNTQGQILPNDNYDVYKVALQPNATYTFADTNNYSGGNTDIHGVAFTSTGSTIDEVFYRNRTTTGRFTNTFTTPSNTAYLLISTRKTDTDIQLEAGSQASTYAPYFTPIELCKLGTYQDYIYKDGDDWKVHKAVGEFVLDGSETWQYDSTYAYFRCPSYSYEVLPATGSTNYSNQKSNYFTVEKTWATFRDSTTANMFFALTNDGYKICVRNISYTDTTTFSRWLSTATPAFYYAAATATDTTITDQTLIAQLEALVAGGAENGTTYIKVSATDPNLPGLLVVEAPKYE